LGRGALVFKIFNIYVSECVAHVQPVESATSPIYLIINDRRVGLGGILSTKADVVQMASEHRFERITLLGSLARLYVGFT